MKSIITFLIMHFAGLFVKGQITKSGLSLWLKPETGITANNTNVTAWKDNSDWHHDAITKTTDYPQLKTSLLNGYPVVHFNGMNNGMETPAFKTFPDKRGVFFIVARINGRSKTSGVGLGNLLSTYHGAGATWQFGATTFKISYYDGYGGEGFPVSDSPLTDWGILTISRYNDTLIRLYRNGQLHVVFPIHNNQPDSNTLKIGFNGRLGGTVKDSIPEVLNGDIAEVIMYSRLLSASEIDDVHVYLASKYGLKLASPPIQKTWWFYGIIGLLLFTSILTISKFISQRKLKQKLAVIEREQEISRERQRISKEMHDDIGAGLTQITLMTESLRKKFQAKELDDIVGTSRRLVNNMGEIIWSLDPEQQTLSDLCAYLREQLNHQLEYTGLVFNIQLPEEKNPFVLTNDQRRNILLVTKEITNNIIKHSNAENISIKATLQKSGIAFEIKDDGIGFDTAKHYSGNGLKNIRSRVQAIGGSLQIIAEPGKGSCFSFLVPLQANI